MFNNKITETDSLNILDYLYFYNGAGVAAADFNNDGLQDLFFVSNQGENQLYINKGELTFEDITKNSGLGGRQENWKTGVTIVDINNDGYPDIYVSVVSGYRSFKGHNLLFINNGDLTFTEKSKEYGIDFAGLSTQASFFDYDKDGDLDLLVLTHSVHSNDTYGDSTLRFKYNEIAGDHLFRNDNGKFSDVTKGSGIYAAPIGYGLGISIADLNNDGWDDIYISNDFFEQDYYYINQKNGKFKESLKSAFGHTSLFSMGNALNDINKDGYVDVLSTDMLPEDLHALKSTINDESLDIYNQEVQSGYYYQYSKNSLQLNVGNGMKFVDISLYSGISATDWTWSPLIEDFNLDGHKDIFFSTGIKKRLNDMDYLKYLGDQNVFKNFGTDRKFDRNKINLMPDGRVHNYLYEGKDLLKFQDISAVNGMSDLSCSNGALMVDLDNDGDKEIVTNNLNQAAFIYRNNTIENDKNKKLSFLSIKVNYNATNRNGIGTKIFLKSDSSVDHQEIQTSSAFQSSQNNTLNFAFKPNEKPQEMLVIWPDNSYQVFKSFNLNKTSILKYDGNRVNKPVQDISTIISSFIKPKSQFNYQNIDARLIAQVKTNQTIDFNYYYLLPHTYLQLPPPIATGDINGDGYDDIYVGGIEGEDKYMLMGQKDGSFKKGKVFAQNFNDADAQAAFVDLNQDGKLDLVVSNADHPFAEVKDIKPLRVYLNRGKNQFDVIPMPNAHALTSKMCFIDINHDGLKDIYLAGAVSFRDYTRSMEAVILLNRGNGKFELGANQQFKELKNIQFVKNLLVSDINKDGFDDLLISAEWQPLQIFLNSKSGLKKWSPKSLENLKGWWQSAIVTDLNHDGQPDLVAGNWGLNNKFNVNRDQPLNAYHSDLDDDGKNDLILSYFYKGKHYPFRPKNDLETELPYLKKKWLSYREMSEKTTEEVFEGKLPEKDYLSANSFESIYISDFLHKNEITALPYLYQQAPIMGLQIQKNNEVIVNGNFWGTIPYEGKYDALGLATLKYDLNKKEIAAPVYWINPAINFNEIDQFQSIKMGKKENYVALTSDGRIFILSENP